MEIIRHIANQYNTSFDYTEIDHPATNQNPETILVIMQVANLKRSKSLPEFGVHYQEGKWRIFAKYGAIIAHNTVFFVAVKDVPDRSIFTVIVTLEENSLEVPLPKELTGYAASSGLIFTEKRDAYTLSREANVRMLYQNGRWVVENRRPAKKTGIVKYNVFIESPSEPVNRNMKSNTFVKTHHTETTPAKTRTLRTNNSW